MFASVTQKTRRLQPSHELWEPHKYQERAVEFLLDRGSAALFLDPGLGKTSITLDAFDTLREEGIAKKMLVIAPLRVCQLVWRQEAKRWTQFRHLKFTFLHGPDKDKLLDDDSDIFLLNPEGCAWLAEKFWKKKLPFDTVVLDELTRFKNGQAIRHKAMMPHMKKAPRRWGLTGSPIPNGYIDLWGQMKILDDGAALGRWFTYFRNKYFEKDYTGFGYDLRRGAEKQIEEAIAPYVLRMASEDYLELPKLIEDIRIVRMPKEARKVYEQMKEDLITKLEGNTVEAGNAAAAYSKLKQMANGAVYSGDGIMEPRKTIHLHDAKIDAVLELVEELSGSPVLIGYEFNHDLARLRKALGGDTPFLGSGVSEKRAIQIEKDWNAGKIPVLLAHPASAAHGLNLQKGNACHVAWFSTTWDYELYDQFMRRVLRQGNEALRVFNHIFIVEDSIDNRTREVILAKGLTQALFFDALNAEIYHDGKTGAPPNGADEKEEVTVMARKLSRKNRAEEPEEEVVEVEEDDDDEAEEEAPARKSRRASRRKLRAKEPDPADDDDDVDGVDDDDEEPVSRRAKRRFSGAVQEKLDAEEGDETEEAEAEDEVAEEVPAPKKRRARRAAKKVEVAEVKYAEGDDEDEVKYAEGEVDNGDTESGKIGRAGNPVFTPYSLSSQDIKGQCVHNMITLLHGTSPNVDEVIEGAQALYEFITGE